MVITETSGISCLPIVVKKAIAGSSIVHTVNGECAILLFDVIAIEETKHSDLL